MGTNIEIPLDLDDEVAMRQFIERLMEHIRNLEKRITELEN